MICVYIYIYGKTKKQQKQHSREPSAAWDLLVVICLFYCSIYLASIIANKHLNHKEIKRMTKK